MQITGKTRLSKAQTTSIKGEIEGFMFLLGFKSNPTAQFNISGIIQNPGNQPLGVHLKGARSSNLDCAIYTSKGAFEGFLILNKSTGVTNEQVVTKYKALPARKAGHTAPARKSPSVQKKPNLVREGRVPAHLHGGRTPGDKRKHHTFSTADEHERATKLQGHLEVIRRAQVTLDKLIEERRVAERMKAQYESLRGRSTDRHAELTSAIQTIIGEAAVTSINIQTQQRIIETAQRAIEQLG